jgi:hypothetical protein
VTSFKRQHENGICRCRKSTVLKSHLQRTREKRNIGITGEGITAAPEILPQILDIRSISV